MTGGLRGTLLLGAVAAMVAGGSTKQAARHILYVDRDSVGGHCSDSRPPQAVTRRTPWCTLTRAFHAAPAGSEVLVRKGRYPMLHVASFAPARTVTFAGYPGERPVLAGALLGTPETSWRAPPSIQNLVLRGFKIKSAVGLTNFSNVRVTGNHFVIRPVAPTHCSSASQSCVVNTPSAFLLTVPGSNLTISGNRIDGGDHGVMFRDGNPPGVGDPRSSTYRNISITHNRFDRMGGVVVQIQNFKGVTVAHNVFANDLLQKNVDPYCHCEAMHVIGGGDLLRVDANFIYGGRGISLQPRYPNNLNCEPICLKLTRATVENNVIVGADFGLWVLSCPGIKIVNNTIWGTQAYRNGLGLKISGAPPASVGVVLANNLIRNLQVQTGASFAVEDYNDVASIARGSDLITPVGPHDIHTDPAFAHPAAPSWNFRLLPGSAGIRQGLSRYAPRADILGHRRRDPPTMGAFEYLTAAATVSAVGRPRVRRLRRWVLMATGFELACSASVTWCPTLISFTFRGSPRAPAGSGTTSQPPAVTVISKRELLPGGDRRPIDFALSTRQLARLAGRRRYVTVLIRVSPTKRRHFVRAIHVRVTPSAG